MPYRDAFGGEDMATTQSAANLALARDENTLFHFKAINLNPASLIQTRSPLACRGRRVAAHRRA
jgi:hypothetical protein